MPLKEYGSEEQKKKSLEGKIAVDKEWFGFLDKFFMDICAGLSDHFIPIGFLKAHIGDGDEILDDAILTVLEMWDTFLNATSESYEQYEKSQHDKTENH